MYPFSMHIYTCDLATQPTRKTKDIKPGCKIEGQLDISGLPELRGKNGQLYKRLIFHVEMTIIGTALEFTLIFQKKRMGQQNVKVEFDEEQTQHWNLALRSKPSRADISDLVGAGSIWSSWLD